MNKETRLAELQKYSETYTKQLARANELLSALQGYSKQTINKTFFVHYFTSHDENGEIRKDWKGNIITSFSFSDKQWEWSSYYKRIYLADSEYIEVNDTSTSEVIRATKEKKELIENWLANNKKSIEKLEKLDEQKILAELRAIKDKYDCSEFWYELLDQVKYN